MPWGSHQGSLSNPFQPAVLSLTEARADRNLPVRLLGQEQVRQDREEAARRVHRRAGSQQPEGQERGSTSRRRSGSNLPAMCVTMEHMETTLNVRIPAHLKRQLDALSRRQHRPSSELVRESLRRYIASEQLAALRKTTVPLAEAQGFITDDDIFDAVS